MVFQKMITSPVCNVHRQFIIIFVTQYARRHVSQRRSLSFNDRRSRRNCQDRHEIQGPYYRILRSHEFRRSLSSCMYVSLLIDYIINWWLARLRRNLRRYELHGQNYYDSWYDYVASLVLLVLTPLQKKIRIQCVNLARDGWILTKRLRKREYLYSFR